MNWAGQLIMVVSYGFVGALTVFCFYRVLTTPGATEHEHAPLEIDTRDTDPSDRC
jgi:hypothetical protein